MLQDLRYAWRTLLKSPGFTVTAVLTLALGIGVNATIFSLLKGAVLRPLPGVRDADELVMIVNKTPAGRATSLSHPDYRLFRDENEAFSGLTASTLVPLSLSGDAADGAERVWGEFVTGNLFHVFGVPAALGRTLLPADDTAGGEPVAVLSHGFWQRRFGSDPAVVGQTMRLNGRPVTVVGVAAPGYRGSIAGLVLDVFLPISSWPLIRPFDNPADIMQKWTHQWFIVYGRLKPGVGLTEARASMSTLARSIAREHPNDDLRQRGVVEPLWKAPHGGQTYMFPILAPLMVAVGLVLVVACANVATLLLVRGTLRRRELAVRAALGAAPKRLLRQLLTESLLLAVLGAGVGFVLAVWVSEGLASPPVPTPFPIALDTRPDGMVYGFTALIAVASAVLFGLLPALTASKSELVPALKDELVVRHSRLGGVRDVLVVGQVAISLLLLVGAGLLLRSADNARRADPGFDPKNVLLVTLDLQPNGYDEDESRDFFIRLGERVAMLPGVESVAFAHMLPLGVFGAPSRSIEVEGYQRDRDQDMGFHYNVVSPGYFETLGIPLDRGRDFTSADGASSRDVVIVNETLARTFWPGREPIGRRIEVSDRWREVVGVARDAKYVRLAEEPQPFFYLPSLQNSETEMTLHVRTAGGPATAAAAVREAVQGLDPHLPLLELGTLEDRLEFSLFGYDMGSTFLAAAGVLALLLACIGLYGVVAYSASQRTRELGVRVALGATRREILALVLGRGMRLIMIGIVLGMAAALVLTSLLGSLLFGVGSTDPATFVATGLLLAAVALLACYIPARHATRVDPLIALRAE
jgi:predicted permease